jgi:hypothetical protein
MLLLIDIFSINRSRGYENPSLDIIVIELCSTGGCPLEEAREHCFQNQSVISVVILISFQCYCGDCSGYIVVILPFLAFYFCSAYFLYLVYYNGTCKKLSCYCKINTLPTLRRIKHHKYYPSSLSYIMMLECFWKILKGHIFITTSIIMKWHWSALRVINRV